MATAGELIGRLFFAQSVARKEHLLTTLYSRHVALQKYYESLSELTDSFAETCMGKYGRPDDIALTWVEPTEGAEEFIAATAAWVEENREQIVDEDDSALQNIIDEIVALHHKTLYLLTLN